MASNDIFGLTKTSQSATEVGHPSVVGILIGGSKELLLVQQIQLNYQRQTQPIYTLGSEDVYIAVGGATGEATLNRAIGGKEGALEPYAGTKCGGNGILKIKTNHQECHKDIGEITCEGATLTRVGFEATAGGVMVTDSATYAFGALKRGGSSGGGNNNSSTGFLDSVLGAVSGIFSGAS